MAKILKFIPKTVDKKVARRLVKMSDEIDSAFLNAIADGIDPKEVAGIVAHRLGVLMANIDEKEELWPFCEQVLKKQAKID